MTRGDERYPVTYDYVVAEGYRSRKIEVTMTTYPAPLAGNKLDLGASEVAPPYGGPFRQPRPKPPQEARANESAQGIVAKHVGERVHNVLAG